jgi:hypothetical protein
MPDVIRAGVCFALFVGCQVNHRPESTNGSPGKLAARLDLAQHVGKSFVIDNCKRIDNLRKRVIRVRQSSGPRGGLRLGVSCSLVANLVPSESNAVTRAEKAGKRVVPLIVPTNNPLECPRFLCQGL